MGTPAIQPTTVAVAPTSVEKLRHAVHHAKLMAPEFPEAAMRLEIESVLGEGLLTSAAPETLQK